MKLTHRVKTTQRMPLLGKLGKKIKELGRKIGQELDKINDGIDRGLKGAGLKPKLEPIPIPVPVGGPGRRNGTNNLRQFHKAPEKDR